MVRNATCRAATIAKMGDVVSSAASIIAVLEIVRKIMAILFKYIMSVKDALKGISSILGEVSSSTILVKVKGLCYDSDHSSLLILLSRPNSPLEACEVAFRTIVGKLETPNFLGKHGKRLAWPLQQSAVHKFFGDCSETESNPYDCFDSGRD